MAADCPLRPWLRRGLRLSLFLACASGAPAQAEPAASPQSGPYVRLGAGVDWPEASGFRDADCSSL
ncbi:MAG: hypothetical protein RLZZ268_1180, partial [Cyanobacteriota bacterium]